MKLTDLRAKVADSNPGDWQKLPSFGEGPTYHEWWDKSTGPSEAWELYHDEHTNIASFRWDVSLTIAWGLNPDRDRRDRAPLWIDDLPLIDGVPINLVDIFWNNALVDRRFYAVVDGEAYVPWPHMRLEDSSDEAEDKRIASWDTTTYDYKVARLVHQLSNHSPDDFHRWMERLAFRVLGDTE